MKRILFTLALFVTSFCFGQIPKPIRHILASSTAQPQTGSVLNCTAVNQNGCNYLSNPGFIPSQYYYNNINTVFTDPFNFDGAGNSLISSWNIATGSPTVWDGVIFPSVGWPEYPNPPANTTGYFFGATGLYNYNNNSYVSESIVQKIPALTANHIYTIDFYKMYMDFSPVMPNVNFPVDRFRIVLMHCSDYQSTFWPITFNVPDNNHYPVNSQTIYCESNVFNDDWERVFTKFTPNQNYDMIWIYPETEVGHQDVSSGIFVSFPEIIDVTNFDAGPPPNTCLSNCNVTIGPLIPNCGPTGAIFTWHGPNSVIPAPPNQQITIDASSILNVGTWSLHMTLPNTITNNTCSENSPTIIDNVIVTACTPNSPPVISPSGTVEYYYTGGEYTATLLFSSDRPSGNQWYVDGILVAGETNQTFNYEWFSINPPIIETHLVSVQNGCFSAGTTVKFITYPSVENCSPNQPIRDHCSPSGINTPYYACENTTTYLQAFDMGPSGNYSWQLTNYGVPGGATMSIVSQNQNVATVNIGLSSLGGGYYGILAKSEFNGLTKYFDYGVTITNNLVATNSDGISTVNGISTIYVGLPNANYMLGFARGLYDMGPGAITQVVPVPVSPYFFSGNTAYLDLTVAKEIKFIRNGMTNFKVEFSNINNDDCKKSNMWVGNPLWEVVDESVNDNEFHDKRTSNLKVFVTPNPVFQQLNLRITENDKQSFNSYSVIITDKMGVVLLQKSAYFSGKKIDISRLEKGVYFVTVTNNKNEKVTAMFSKL